LLHLKIFQKFKQIESKSHTFSVHLSVYIWTGIPAGTETEISVQVEISAGTGTELNFGRSLVTISSTSNQKYYKFIYL